MLRNDLARAIAFSACILLFFSQTTSADERLDQSLMSQAGYGNDDKVVELIAQGANVNATNEYGHTALQRAVNKGKLSVVRLLIEKGANVNAKTKSGDSILKEASGNLAGAEVTKLLLEAGATPDPAALGIACWLNQTEKVTLLLNAGISPDVGLGQAAQGGHVELVRLLLDKGAKVDGSSENDTTPLHLATLQGGLPTVKLLIDRGANVNAVNKQGETPLHMAVAGDGNLDIVKLLVNSGSKINLANDEGITPIRFAGRYQLKGIYDWLLSQSGGKEPAPVPAVNRKRQADKPTSELIAELVADKAAKRDAAVLELALRGKEIMPDVLKSIESGTDLGHFHELFAAMGPNAEAVLPLLEAELRSNKKERVFMALMSMEAIRSGARTRVDNATLQAAADALYDGIVDPKADVMAGFYADTLFALGDPAKPAILRLLRHENAGIRAGIAQQIQRIAFQSEEIRTELIKLQNEDPNAKVRAAAASGLANPRFKSADAKAALIEKLRTPPIPWENIPPDAGPARETAAAKKQEVDVLLAQSARTLAGYGPAIVDELLPLIRTNGDPAWEQYRKVWAHLGADAVPKLLPLVDDKDPRIREIAFQELGRLAATSDAALQIQISRLNSNDPTDRRFAIEAVWKIRGPVALPLRPHFLRRLNDGEIPVQVRLLALKSALLLDRKATQSAIEVGQFLPQIIESASSGAYLDRCAALLVLADLGSAARPAVPTLVAQTKVELPPVSPAARSWMGGPISDEAKKELTERAQADMLLRLAREAIQAIEKDSDAAK